VKSASTQLSVIGWREWFSIPALGIPHIKAKIDTGARTSALHTFELNVYQGDSGKERAKFRVHPLQKNLDYVVECDCELLDKRSVKDSGGHEEIRPFVRLPVTLGEHTWEINVSLTNRDNMKFRMLLGRTAMAKRFLVNPALSYQLGPPPGASGSTARNTPSTRQKTPRE